VTEPAGAAQRWLDGFVTAAGQRSVLAVPYGDADVSALVRQGAAGGDALLDRAFAASAAVLDSVSVSAAPVVAPPDGRLSPEALGALDPGTTAVLAPQAVPRRLGSRAVLQRTDGGRVLVAGTGAAVRGPGPNDRRSALAVRQRLLAEAAVHALSGSPDVPLVWLLPAVWDPGPQWRLARFFSGLDVPWTEPVPVGQVLAGLGPRFDGATPPPEPATLDPAGVRYPDSARQAELGNSVVSHAESLVREATVLDDVLADDTTVDEELTRQALLSTSVWSRARRGLAAQRARESRRTVEGWLNSISVRGPSFVTMSDETGTFQVTLVNGLDQPVDVRLDATVPQGALTLETPGAIRLEPHGHGAVRIQAHASDIGIHLVTLQPVSTDGVALGSPASLSIRSSRVGFFLWVVMAVAGAVLLVLVVVRIWRRVRQRRATHGPLLQARTGRPDRA